MRMTALRQSDDPLIRRAIHDHVNLAVSRGALYAALVGLVGTSVLAVMIFSTGDRTWRLPALFTIASTIYCVLLWHAGRTRRVRGSTGFALMAVFVSIPTAYFLAAGVLSPEGIGAYIHGSISYAYLVMIGVTGFVHSFRISLACGVIAALGYLLCWALAHPTVAQLQAPSPEMYHILTSWFVAAMKALLMVATGLITGTVSIVSRRLLLRTLDEERQKESMQRLFGQYVTGSVNERVLKRAASTAGERVEVVVLFSDLRGFSTFAEGRDPAEVVERLNAYFERMVEAIQSEGGVVDKFIGDAVMALFGGLVELENPCASGVRAAIRMREALADLNSDWDQAGIAPFDNGIGLHVGQVLQGPIGSHDRKEFTAIGDAVNTAARLEAQTKTSNTPILITHAVQERLTDELKRAFAPLGEVSVKGKREVLTIYGWGLEKQPGI